MSETQGKNLPGSDEQHTNLEVIAMLQPIVTMLAAQEERLSKKIDGVHNDVRRINGSVADAHRQIGEIKQSCAVRGEHCNLVLENVKNAKWVLERLEEITKHPKTTAVLFLLFVMTCQVIVLEAIEHKWLGEVWNYVRLIF